MSFGLSPGDIRLAWQLGSFLHEKCFTKAQGADVLYLRFGGEIKSFANNLQQLIAIIEHANSQRPKRPWRNHDDECQVALQPVSEAVGDFRKTLKECEKLLDDNERFRRDRAGFVDNVVWHMSTQRDVDSLRDRVHFHSTKLLILIKPFEIQLLLEIRRELEGLRRDVSDIKGLLVHLLTDEPLLHRSLLSRPTITFPEIPREISGKFLESMHVNTPDTFQEETGWPLKEGFDALVYHFSQSTVKFNPGFDTSQRTPEETQFVNLLKSKWIFDKLEESPHLSIAGTASLWRSALSELETDIVKEYKRFDSNQLNAPPKDVICRLPAKCFQIWVVEAPPLLPPDLAEQRPFEEHILELLLPDSIGTRKSTLHVFRRSAVEFRIVTTTRDSSNPSYLQEKDFIVNTDVTQIIPAYATPGDEPTGHNMLLSNRHVQDLRWQYLRNAEDIQSLQQALVGYRVHHSMGNVSWSINGSDKSEKSGKATLQLWQLQTLQTSSESSSATPTPRNPSFRSPTSSAAGSQNMSRRSSVLTGTTTLFSGSSATSIIEGSRGSGTALLQPEPPVMIFFTLLEGKYAFLHVELEDHIYVNAESCDCRRNSRRECRTVILESKKKRISLHRYHASQKSGKGLYTWDLARFRSPRHPEFDEVEVLSKVKYLTLAFETVELKIEFLEELKLLEKVRCLEQKMYKGILAERHNRDRRPPRR